MLEGERSGGGDGVKGAKDVEEENVRDDEEEKGAEDEREKERDASGIR
jgi:hypothetical protein